MYICILELHATSLCLVILLAQNVHSASVLGSVVLGQPPLWLTRMLKAQQSIRILVMQQFVAGCLILADVSYHFLWNLSLLIKNILLASSGNQSAISF